MLSFLIMAVLIVLFVVAICYLLLLSELMILKKVNGYCMQKGNPIKNLFCSVFVSFIPLLMPVFLLYALVYPIILISSQKEIELNFKRLVAFASPTLLLSVLLFLCLEFGLGNDNTCLIISFVILLLNLIIPFIYFGQSNKTVFSFEDLRQINTEIPDSELLLWSNIVIMTPALIFAIQILLN